MENENQSKPLVSVVVFSYNSSLTIVETLDSIKNQTYQQIELIITDDCSKDGTLEIAENWLIKNKDRFHDALFLKSSQNTGVSANGNRGCYASHGEWIKVIAADDVLLPNCIEDYVNFVHEYPQFGFVFAKEKGIGNDDEYKRWPFKDVHRIFELLNHNEQFVLLCQHNFIPTPTFFFSSKLFSELGGYDESIPFLEDRPLLLKAYRKGCRMGFLNTYTVAYRFSSNSISQPESKSDKRELFKESYSKMTKLSHRYLEEYSIGAKFFSRTSGNRTRVGRMLFYLNVFNPFYYKNRRIIHVFNAVVKSNRN